MSHDILTTQIAALAQLAGDLLEVDRWGEMPDGAVLAARVAHIGDQLQQLVNPWQPIETAPKDGQPIHVYQEAGPQRIACFVDGEWTFFQRYAGPRYVCFPTHWMPLPSAPEAK